MKCVAVGNEIRRVTDAEAVTLVRGGGKYVSKTEWRKSDPKYPERRQKKPVAQVTKEGGNSRRKEKKV